MMKVLLAAGLFLVLLQACPLMPGAEKAHITGITDRNGHDVPNGGTTTERVQHVAGTVENPAGADASEFGGRIIVDRNGETQYVTPTRNSNGTWTFSGDMVLTQGRNDIRVVLEDENGNTVGNSGTYTVNADIPARDLTVTLTWDTDRTDVDMHVWSPSGEHAYYSNKRISDGFLDVDDTDGYGPEVFTAENASAGNWVVKIRYYSNHGVTAPSTATVKISKYEGAAQTYTHTFTSDQAHSDDPANDWLVANFTMP